LRDRGGERGSDLPIGRANETPDLPNPPVAELRVTCRLAGLDYQLLFTDEQAKLNVNQLLQDHGRAEAQSRTRRLIRGGSDAGLRPRDVTLRPMSAAVRDTKTGELDQSIAGYGQVFGAVTPATLIGEHASVGAAAHMTCWGDGKVSIRRASAEVIKQRCEKALGRHLTGALLDARDRDPYRPLPEMLRDLDELDDKQSAKLRDMLTDGSRCHGLWVIARGRHRAWYSLSIGIVSAGDDLGAAPGGDDLGAAPGGNEAASAAAPRGQRFDFNW